MSDSRTDACGIPAIDRMIGWIQFNGRIQIAARIEKYQHNGSVIARLKRYHCINSGRDLLCSEQLLRRCSTVRPWRFSHPYERKTENNKKFGRGWRFYVATQQWRAFRPPSSTQTYVGGGMIQPREKLHKLKCSERTRLQDGAVGRTAPCQQSQVP
jgi:hypothetical protein